MDKMHGKSALVIGGSFAGLLSARVLSNYFEQVTIVERDVVHDVPESRKGQAQTRHLHGLLAQGLKIVTGYFPDLMDGLLSGGNTLLDMAQTMRWYCYGGYRTRFEFGISGISMSRPFLEWHIRQRVLALPNVTLINGYSVEKLLTNDNRKQVKGRQIVKQGKGTDTENMDADLVLDASGRGSRTPKWLEELGYSKPEESTVTCGAGYATRVFERDVSHPGSLDWVFITPQAPKEYKAGAALPVEQGNG